MSDLISRQAAIEALYDWELSYTWDEHCKEDYDSPYIVSPSKVINGLPSAQPEPQWIPCSERLPVEGESVLLCDRYGDMTLGRLVRTDEGCKWDIHAWWNDIDDWNAWMPLPEIWGGEEDG